jgi:hypothetical protein
LNRCGIGREIDEGISGKTSEAKTLQATLMTRASILIDGDCLLV